MTSLVGVIAPGTQHLQNLHPLIVHGPLALLPGAALLYLLAWTTGRVSLAGTALWFLVLATASAAVAVATGLRASEGVMVDPTVREQLLARHESWMLSVLGMSVALTCWALVRRPFPARGRSVFMLLLLSTLVMLAHGADYGGRLVYDYNAGGNACGQPIEFSR